MNILYSFSTKKVGYFLNSSFSQIISFLYFYFRVLVSPLKPFSAHLIYFISISLLGFVAMKVSNPSISGLDLFFTSMSASTVSSMSTIEMEVFSNIQLLIITLLMLVGGEVFTSMIGLHFLKFKIKKTDRIRNLAESDQLRTLEVSLNQLDHLGLVNHPEMNVQKPSIISLELGTKSNFCNEELKCKSLKCLSRVVLCYHLTIHVFGSTLVYLYISLVSSSRQVLQEKGIDVKTFSVFVTTSTFSNCGFIPTNENMTIFSKNSGFLLILIPQILLGNTLFAPCLHFLIWVLNKFTKREEFRYLLKNHSQVGYGHLLSKLQCLCIAGTAFGFILVQLVIFSLLEWNSEITVGLNSYEKAVGSLFQVVNTRHAGESAFDISMASPAILVMFVVMMYLPAYVSVCPIEGFAKDSTNGRKNAKGNNNLVDYILFSQLSYVIFAIILVCVTEKGKMKTDPLNFNVLNITLEVISAYGNVGFSTGYSCKRRLENDGQCRDATYGLVGRWSGKGKIILIIVMLFGRLKIFTKGCGKAWNFS